ncbi:patatin-like phospholipase family protein [Alkanindiges illinoisensis]|uniref:patatin-like phospholipase family protein n=1 Tax=Alkanindiges illinoisensis TaxID=197183 RepID=UPI0005535AA8|nr:patatin-like phospholipase family protein [Alkanindiges illinoisensis]
MQRHTLTSMLLASSVLLSGCSHMATPPSPATITKIADAREYELQKAGLALRQKLGKNQPMVALVLGSGGARGYAHIGVIRILETYGIKPQLIVGTSAGSIVGALYASGKNATQMDKIASSLKSSDVRDITLSRQGFFNSEKVADFVNRQVNNRSLEQLDIPLFVVATELQTGTRAVFNYGNTGQAVSASVSIPSMFVPTSISKKQYVDGGLVSPVPVEVAKSLGADVIIAVNILAQPENTPTTNIWGLFNQNINVMQNRLASYELKDADIVIQPNIKEKQHIFSLDSRMQNIVAGEEATLFQMDKIKYALETARQKLAQQSTPVIQTLP